MKRAEKQPRIRDVHRGRLPLESEGSPAAGLS
jgi:hypothetical protein